MKLTVMLLGPGLLLVSWCGQIARAKIESIPQENLHRLMDDIFASYNCVVRPTLYGNATSVYIAIFLISIRNLDEKSQVLETSVIISLEWNDPRLFWNPSRYGGVSSVVCPQSKVWLPDIITENSIESQTQMGYDQNLVRVTSCGVVRWRPSEVMRTACDIDVTYYPFDTQTCSIVVRTWMSTSYEIDIFPANGSGGMMMDAYCSSGTWGIISNEVNVFTNPDNLTIIKFTLKLKRYRTFYIVNIILPVLFLSFTASMVFYLPAQAGEKIAMGITVLLAYAVYLTIIADNMPQTSLQVSYLAVYLTLLLGLTSMGVMLAVVVLHIHHKSVDCRVGDRTKRITRKLRKILCINQANLETKGESQNKTSQGLNISTGEVQHHLRSMTESHSQPAPSATSINDKATVCPPSCYEEEITWQKVAETVDRAVFVHISILIAAITTIFIPLLAIGG